MSKAEYIKENKAVSERVRNIRIAMNKSQESFASLLDISLDAYKKFESAENQITLKSLRILNQELNISSDYILFGKRSDVDDVWEQFQHCTEKDKMQLMIRILAYFTVIKEEKFTLSSVLEKIDAINKDEG